ncbi:envelope stress response membrane protein PspB [Motiliproteus coralliicola]|uniref:Envelope stress response membrane protein PspB n=1 Tax=Motiliproteus coralliicola TaxID=2283196 RepID=A0A369WMK2_9GAMM|nr:envelope stress response membrane protein PspB [Motiliproteus coralliicola]RDE22721.1 envelope stress response membrane protein PspB [Motiliproteus coralliicola]
MSTMVFFFVPSIVFLTIVAPLWLILHYWSKRKAQQGLSQEEQQLLRQMAGTIEGLEQRINTLERILTDQDTGWKRESD